VTTWSFLTNHARVLLCIARDPGMRRRGQQRRHYSCPEQSAGSESSGEGRAAARGAVGGSMPRERWLR